MTTKEICKKYQIHRVTVSKLRNQGKLKGHLADDQGQYLFEDPGAIVLGKKK
jgi:predicted site-specific integrase-resolvase